MTFYIISCEGEKKDTGETVKAKPADSGGVQQQDESRAPGRSSTVPDAVVSQTGGRDFLLYSETFQEAVFPEDYEIGPLETAETAAAAEILEIAEQFLEGLGKGRIEEKLLASLKKDFVLRVLKKDLAEAVQADYRIGMINYSEDPARADVRLFGPEGSGTGVMYFVLENGWKIYDLHLDLSDSGQPAPGDAEEEYDPVKIKM